MKHYSYTASDLWKRATQLADVENTKFLKYEEKLGYLNDSFRAILQWARNMGEKLFVKEVALNGNGNGNGYTAYTLPDDFYSIVNLTSNGIPVKRKSDSERSGGYDIVNDELRIYGLSQNLILTYNMMPLTITMPNETLKYESVANTFPSVVKATAGNNAIVDVNGNHYLWNVVENEIADLGQLSDVDISLGKNHFVYSAEGKIAYASFDQTLLKMYNGSAIGFGQTSDGNATYTIQETKDEKSFLTTKCFDRELLSIEGGAIGGSIPKIFWNENLYIDQLSSGMATLHLNGQDILLGKAEYLLPLPEYDGRKQVFLQYTGEELRLCTIEENSVRFETIDEVSKYPIVLGLTEYGAICTRGSTIDVVSWIPETELNFPNDFYFSAMATDVAVRIAQKQNSNFQGLQALLESEKTTFVNTMNSTGAYPRMKMI